MNAQSTEYLSIKEAAEMLSIHPETLRRWDRAKKIISIRIGASGHRKFRKTDIELLTRNQSKDFYRLHLQFQNYMLDKGYESRKREPLISPIFSTTFTPSGGPDLVYEIGKGQLFKNVVINQPCIRHWDIELVGDNKHLSFFNMSVTASTAATGFSRNKNITDYINFLVTYLRIDLSRVYASYCGKGFIKGFKIDEDSEIRTIWKENGILEERQICFSEKLVHEAFVANSVEPYGGYRSELFYDTRTVSKPIRSVDEFVALEKAGVILEFFTHVKYWCEVKNGNIEARLPDSSIVCASGTGPQRLLRILENVHDINDISILQSIRQIFERFTELENEDVDILTDHIRALTFLIGDGAANLTGRNNRSRRSILNKYKRRIKDRIEKIPLASRSSTLNLATQKAIDLFSVLFPVFEERRRLISKELIDQVMVG